MDADFPGQADGRQGLEAGERHFNRLVRPFEDSSGRGMTGLIGVQPLKETSLDTGAGLARVLPE